MPRIRCIKPDFWTDEKVVELSPFARLLFIGMWNFVDDYGRGEYSPSRLKMQILPADSVNISELVGEIRGKKLIDVYQVENKEYFVVCGFAKHQKIDKRTASKIPDPLQCPPNPPESPRKSTLDMDKEEDKEKEKTLCDSGESHSANPGCTQEQNQSMPLREWFENVMWPAVPSAKKRGKELTWKEIAKLKPDEHTRQAIVTYFSAYPSVLASYEGVKGAFFPEMQDPMRVIRNRRYQDVLIPYESNLEAWKYE